MKWEEIFANLKRLFFQMNNRYMKTYSTLLIIRVIQIKSLARDQLTPVRMTVLKRPEITSIGKNMEKQEQLCTFRRNVKCLSYYRKQYGVYS